MFIIFSLVSTVGSAGQVMSFVTECTDFSGYFKRLKMIEEILVFLITSPWADDSVVTSDCAYIDKVVLCLRDQSRHKHCKRLSLPTRKRLDRFLTP